MCHPEDVPCEISDFGSSEYWGRLIRFIASSDSNFDEKHHSYGLVTWFYNRLAQSSLSETDVWPIIMYAYKTAEAHYFVEEYQWDHLWNQDDENVTRWIVNHILTSLDFYQLFKGPCEESQVKHSRKYTRA